MSIKKISLIFIILLSSIFTGCSSEGEYVEQGLLQTIVNGTQQSFTFEEATINISNDFSLKEVEKDGHFTYLITDANNNSAYLQAVKYEDKNIEKIQESVKDNKTFSNFTKADWVILNTIKNNINNRTILSLSVSLNLYNDNEWVKLNNVDDKIYYITATDNICYFIINNNLTESQISKVLNSFSFEKNTVFSQELKDTCENTNLIDEFDAYANANREYTIGEKL